MERLTEEDYGDSYCLKKCHPNDCYCEDMNCPINNCGELIEALRKLGKYEKEEEQGLLVRLPCKVGDVLYCIDNGIVETLIVNSFRIYNFNRVEIDFENASGFTLCTFAGELDDGYFLTREEAEKKLEELENGK
nr:MAG TPA: hypothetical protein [Caudoviricetes sp.]